jgi:hypothetical protein
MPAKTKRGYRFHGTSVRGTSFIVTDGFIDEIEGYVDVYRSLPVMCWCSMSYIPFRLRSMQTYQANSFSTGTKFNIGLLERLYKTP